MGCRAAANTARPATSRSCVPRSSTGWRKHLPEVSRHQGARMSFIRAFKAKDHPPAFMLDGSLRASAKWPPRKDALARERESPPALQTAPTVAPAVATATPARAPARTPAIGTAQSAPAVSPAASPPLHVRHIIDACGGSRGKRKDWCRLGTSRTTHKH